MHSVVDEQYGGHGQLEHLDGDLEVATTTSLQTLNLFVKALSKGKLVQARKALSTLTLIPSDHLCFGGCFICPRRRSAYSCVEFS